jgi:hypothetical protein
MEQIALVSEVQDLSLPELTRGAAAIQKQVLRDFARVWTVQATVSAFGRLEDVPLGYWRVLVVGDIHAQSIGFHRSQDGQPFALVLFREDWATTASHEILEMLADPSGDRVLAGESPDASQGQVEFLVEVCDPCADPELGYDIDGFRVSDFVTPQYYVPVAIPGAQYSFKGHVTAPYTVLSGGYLCWRLPGTNEWFQATADDELQIVPIPGPVTGASLRESIDRHTARLRKPRKKRAARGTKLKRVARQHLAARTARAALLHAQIAALTAAISKAALE